MNPVLENFTSYSPSLSFQAQPQIPHILTSFPEQIFWNSKIRHQSSHSLRQSSIWYFVLGKWETSLRLHKSSKNLYWTDRLCIYWWMRWIVMDCIICIYCNCADKRCQSAEFPVPNHCIGSEYKPPKYETFSPASKRFICRWDVRAHCSLLTRFAKNQVLKKLSKISACSAAGSNTG